MRVAHPAWFRHSEPVGEKTGTPDTAGGLMALLGTAPAPGLPEGLHYPRQLAAIAEQSGLAVEPIETLDDVLRRARAQIRAKYEGQTGVATEEPIAVKEPPERAAACAPSPTIDDLTPARALRERLAAALWGREPAQRRKALASAATDFSLFPCLDEADRQTVCCARNDFVSQLAAVMVGEVLQLVSAGLSKRVRRCDDRECAQPFLDRTRPGNALYCSERCATRVRARRRRERLFGQDQPIG